MLRQIFYKRSDIIILQRNILSLLCVILLLIVFLLVICLTKKDTNVILVPSNLDDKISVSSSKPHNDYLEAITRDIVNTILNLTPNNVDYAERVILGYSNGRSYGVLKNQFSEIKNDVISRKISTAFYPISMYPDNKKLTVIVEGILYNYLGQKEVSKATKQYEIKYEYKTGKLSIVSFKEIISDSNDEEQ